MKILEIEWGSIRSQPAENSLWKTLWTCRKTDCLMMMKMMMVVVVVVVVMVMCLFRRLSLGLHVHVYFIRFWWRLNYDSCSWAMAARVPRLKVWNLEDSHSVHLHVQLAALWLQPKSFTSWLVVIVHSNSFSDSEGQWGENIKLCFLCVYETLSETSATVRSPCYDAKTGSTYWILSVISKESET